jgi:effector-binding domain-containing protein
MTTTEPIIVHRDEQPYMGIRTQVGMPQLPAVIPQLHDEIYQLLEKRGVSPSGAPFIRYHVINMAAELDVEMGWPVAAVLPGEGNVSAELLPAGQYATLLYTGDYSGLMDANRVLIEWAEQNGIAWDRWEDEKGDAFGARIEIYHTDPGNEQDPAKWETEVAIRLAAAAA